ncbi:MAG TPA: DegT/DnrJ/EryC1/StrS family aminotransferase [Azospirillum sp.]|nr:DegT/DnrJ/EryC1/StrS family aminotransferase [Azospirillum sp.]
MIPVNEPVLGPREMECVTDALRSGWISSAGSYIDAFERNWAAYCGRRHGVAVSNGTTALQVAARALGLGPGDEVIMPTFTIVSCALAVVETGAVPVLVDSEPRTWGMDVAKLEALVTPRTKAIMVVHIYGHPVDMDPVLALAERHGLAVIEDAAEVHGAEYLSGRGGPNPVWRRCGGFGDVSTFSFYANKIVTTGEGGMVLTDDDAVAARLRSLRNLCFRPDRRFLHDELGYNYRLTNLQAAIGVAQIERIGETIAAKRRIAALYDERLGNLPGLQLPAAEEWVRHVYWMYGLVLDESLGIDAADMMARLKARGVEARPFFLGMHEQPVFHARGLFRDDRHPVAERIARQGFYLPSGAGLTEDQIDTVAEAVRESLR